jgi:hypothetical protein
MFHGTAAEQAPNVKLFNATAAEDLVIKPCDDVPGGK